MKKITWLTLAMFSLGLTIIIDCGRSGVDSNEEPTDEDAIYDIIRYDYPEPFNPDFIDFSVPDTTLELFQSYQVINFWRNFQSDSFFVKIDIYGSSDSIDMPHANVIVKKFIRGTLEVIALDTAGGGSERVRFSKPFRVEADINAVFEQVVSSAYRRRGWILSRISDVVSSGYSSQISKIEIVPEDNPDTLFESPLFNVSVLSDNYVREFAPEESVTVRVYTTPSDAEYYVTLKYPVDGGFALRQLGPNASGEYVTGFRFPNSTGYGHFFVDVVDNDMVASDTSIHYAPAGVGVLFRLPW
jgi:hypothetical protein